MRVVGSVLEGLGARFGRFGMGLGAVLGVLGAPYGVSVARLDANMAQKSDKGAKKLVSLKDAHPNLEKNGAKRRPKGGQRRAKWRQNGSKNRI